MRIIKLILIFPGMLSKNIAVAHSLEGRVGIGGLVREIECDAGLRGKGN